MPPLQRLFKESDLATAAWRRERELRSKLHDVSRNAEQIRFLVLAAQREGQRVFADALRPLGVTPTQAEAIRVLSDYGSLTLAELGGLLIAETGSPSRLVAGLVKGGHVARTSSCRDRRAVILTLTDQGRDIARGIAEAEAVLYAAIEDTAGGHDIEAVVALLRSFVDGRITGSALKRRGLL
jgi:DNA-binding MarR family transcriptional regulator